MSSYFEITNCKIVKSTSGDGRENQGAALVKFLDYPSDPSEWIPWAAIDDGGITKDGETGTLCLKRWKALELGFEESHVVEE